jgi:FixJ family two-component response regulator
MTQDIVSDALVYVVDDDLSVRRALSRLLRSVGLAAETFPTAEAFLASPNHDRPGCLVLDIILPGVSGLELQAALRKAERLLPIIFITGHGKVAMSVRAMKDGAVDFLQKPFNDQELLDCIQRGIATSRQLRAEWSVRMDIQQRRARLTAREREVMDLLLEGRINRHIAKELGNAEKTIKIHRRRVMDKMEVRSVAELVWLADQGDLLEPRT